MTEATMTRDPDLDKACIDLLWVAHRVRVVEAILADVNAPGHYQRLAAMKHELADLRDHFRCRAEVLNINPRSLMMIVEKVDYLRKRNKRKPSPQIVEAAIRDALYDADVAATTARSELALAQYADAQAGYALRAAQDANRYLEASR